MSYKVKLNIFEGPLDLLLFLIKREKIDLYDIPIASITRQYLEYLELMKLLDLEIAGEFLVIAATLMHIKSKMLLPQDESDLEEEEEEDPREELVRRLLEYKKYKEAASDLADMQRRNKDVFLRKGDTVDGKIILDDGTEYFEASLFDLITAFRKILKDVPKKTFHKVIKDEFSVSDKIHEIYHILAERPKILFSSLFRKARDKNEIIVIFLAILELIKMREIFITQKDFFEEIEIVRNPDVIKSDLLGEEG
jgi:segregation and condensation protein A